MVDFVCFLVNFKRATSPHHSFISYTRRGKSGLRQNLKWAEYRPGRASLNSRDLKVFLKVETFGEGGRFGSLLSLLGWKKTGVSLNLGFNE